MNALTPDVTLNVALTLAPGATGPAVGAAVLVVPVTNDVHPVGAARLNSSPIAGAPVVFVKVTVVSCDDPGENVWRPGGAAMPDAGATRSAATSYFAATTFA